jgi:hypothetical protein
MFAWIIHILIVLALCAVGFFALVLLWPALCIGLAAMVFVGPRWGLAIALATAILSWVFINDVSGVVYYYLPALVFVLAGTQVRRRKRLAH